MSCSETLEIQFSKAWRTSKDLKITWCCSKIEFRKLRSLFVLSYIAKSAWKEFVQWTHNFQFCHEQYESLDSELKKKLPAIFDWVKSNEKALKLNVWQKIPEVMASVAQRAMLESIARCSKRQISWIQFKCKSQTAILYETFGKQFASNTNFCIVQFVAGRQVFPFATNYVWHKKITKTFFYCRMQKT